MFQCIFFVFISLDLIFTLVNIFENMVFQHIQQFIIIYNASIEEKPQSIKLFNHNVNKIILKLFLRVEMSQRVKISRDIWYIFHKFKPAKKYMG